MERASQARTSRVIDVPYTGAQYGPSGGDAGVIWMYPKQILIRPRRTLQLLQSKRLRVGIIGCGKIADGHAEVLRYMEGAQLVAVCDREPILAEQLAVRFGVPAWYTDAETMLASEQLDVVHITTPPQVRLALTRLCVAAGAHVFLEKPIALNAADARAIVESVENAGKMMSINYWPNFDPVAMDLKKMLADGAIGDVVHVESNIGYDLGGAYGQALMQDENHWVHALPGKLFHNILDHICNRITWFVGNDAEPEVQAMAYRWRQPNGTRTDNMLDELRVMVQAGRLSAYGTLSSHARPTGNFLKVYGTKATAEMDYNNRTLVTVVSQKYPGSPGRLIPAFQAARGFWRQGWRNVGRFRRKEFQFFAGMETLLTQFHHAIRTGGQPPIRYREILQVAQMMDDIHEQVYPTKAAPAHEAVAQ